MFTNITWCLCILFFQGGYVLYRLFWKPEEKTERSSPKEMDRSGNSPTTIRSSRDNQEANEEANTPLNKKSLESALHDPIELPNSAETPAGPRKMCLADRNDNLVATAPVVSHIPFQGHAAGPTLCLCNSVKSLQAFNIWLYTIDPHNYNFTTEFLLASSLIFIITSRLILQLLLQPTSLIPRMEMTTATILCLISPPFYRMKMHSSLVHSKELLVLMEMAS
jgi:hypothetical protein